MPFIVGSTRTRSELDAELARLAEDYFKQAFHGALKIQPQFHRVVPIGENVRNSMEVHPYKVPRRWSTQQAIVGCAGLHLPQAERADR